MVGFITWFAEVEDIYHWRIWSSLQRPIRFVMLLLFTYTLSFITSLLIRYDSNKSLSFSPWQESFHRLLHKQDGTRAEWEYPFAVAGINISFMLAQMLDLQSGKIAQETKWNRWYQTVEMCLYLCFLTGKPSTLAGIRFLEFLEEDEMAFDNLYCVAFQMMDAQWLAKRASYMEFNVNMSFNQTCLQFSNFRFGYLLTGFIFRRTFWNQREHS